MTVTLYSKPNCQQCVATKMAMERSGITFEEVDITKDSDAYALVLSLGYRQAPVVVAEDKHWSGFRPDMISSLVAG